jgi:crotonobetainyl-CoA:carnitine CoA-transferase CaiB-like acyl-CoA transferase
MGVGAGVDTAASDSVSEPDWDAVWAASGAMALTGWPDRDPLPAPHGLMPEIDRLGRCIERASAALGERVRLDWPALLGERAALAHLARQGDVSCGGGTRLLAAADGWLAVTLARDQDAELLPAWLGPAIDPHDPWPELARAVGERPASALVAEGAPLGLPVARLGETRPVGAPVTARPLGDAAAPEQLADVVVVDLSALWAGPLCAHLLGLAGARVIKVESSSRPDGARGGPQAFFDLLHAGHESVAVDFTVDHGRAALAALVARADVVIEGSRPRALRQLGIDAEDVLRDGRCRVWVSLTGHGRDGEAGQRAGFGDDTAVAGGLVARDPERGLCFCADAVADPVAGLTAAAATLDALRRGGRWLLDVSLARCAAASVDNPSTAPVRRTPYAAAPPRARPAAGPAPDLGADTAGVLAELDIAAG